MFYDRFCEVCREKGTKPTIVIQELGLSSGNMTNWKKGRTPKTDVINRVAEHLGVSIDYLLEKTDIKEAPSQNEDAISEAEKKIHQNIKLLNDEGLEKAIEYIDFLIAQEKQKRSKSDRDS